MIDPDVPVDPPRVPVTDQPEYPGPTTPPEYANADPDAVAQQLAEQRERLAQPAANLDVHGAPHFLRNVDGEEVCGQCGDPFPCATYKGLEQSAFLDSVTPAGQLLPTMAEAATAAGMDLDEFEARLRQARRL